MNIVDKYLQEALTPEEMKADFFAKMIYKIAGNGRMKCQQSHTMMMKANKYPRAYLDLMAELCEAKVEINAVKQVLKLLPIKYKIPMNHPIYKTIVRIDLSSAMRDLKEVQLKIANYKRTNQVKV